MPPSSDADSSLIVENCKRSSDSLALAVSYRSQRVFGVSVDPRKIGVFLTGVVSSLIGLSTLGQTFKYLLNGGHSNFLINFLYLNKEKNLPTLYSSAALLVCSFLLLIIARQKDIYEDQYQRHWKWLSYIFLYLSLDEALSLHERTVGVVRNYLDVSGYLYYAWVIPAAGFLVLFSLAYFRFTMALPALVRALFTLAGSLFVFGALGVEMIGGKIYTMTGKTENTVIYSVMATLEESLEMIAIAIFICTLIYYLEGVIRQSVSLVFGPKCKLKMYVTTSASDGDA